MSVLTSASLVLQRRFGRQRLRQLILGSIPFVFLISLWQMNTSFGWLAPVFIPPLGDVFEAIVFLQEDCPSWGAAFAMHADCLMTNHVHLLVTPERERSLPLMIQAMGRAYVQRLNARYNRTGTLWEGRYKADLVQHDGYLLACQRYIELNPVRAGLVLAPGEYRYSSYAHHAIGTDDPLVTSHACYLDLHIELSARRQANRALFNDTLTLYL